MTPPDEPSHLMAWASAMLVTIPGYLRYTCFGGILTVLDEQNTLVLGHVLLEVLLTKTINVCGSTTGNGVVLLVQRTTKRYAVHLTSVLVIVASHNDTCSEVILVVVAQLLEH